MTQTPDQAPDQPDPDLAGAGLSATSTTASDLSPGDDAPGTTYGSPTGAGGAGRESTQETDDEGATAEGDVEGA